MRACLARKGLPHSRVSLELRGLGPMAKAEAKRRCSSALRRTPSAETTFIVICNEGVAIATQQITPDKFGSETSPDTADGDASFWLP